MAITTCEFVYGSSAGLLGGSRAALAGFPGVPLASRKPPCRCNMAYRPKVNRLLPAATLTYCLPSTLKVIGDACIVAPV